MAKPRSTPAKEITTASMMNWGMMARRLASRLFWAKSIGSGRGGGPCYSLGQQWMLYSPAGVPKRDFQDVPRGTIFPEGTVMSWASLSREQVLFVSPGGTENVPRGTILISTSP